MRRRTRFLGQTYSNPKTVAPENKWAPDSSWSLFLSKPVRQWDVFRCKDTTVYYTLGTLFKRVNPSKVLYDSYKYIPGHLLNSSLHYYSLPLCVPRSPRLRAAVCWEEVFIKTTQCLHPLRCTDGFCWTLSFSTWGKSQDAASLKTFDKVKEVLKASPCLQGRMRLLLLSALSVGGGNL